MKIPVIISTHASYYIGEVNVEKVEDFADAAEKLWKKTGFDSPTLCHQCSSIELRDFDIEERYAKYYFDKDQFKVNER